MDRTAASLSTSVHLTLEQELLHSVVPSVEDHWNAKVLSGIIPTEVKQKGSVDLAIHVEALIRLAHFEAENVERILPSLGSLTGKKVHYGGIGTALALKLVTTICNKNGAEVVAYDTSSVACENGLRIFSEVEYELSEPHVNTVFLADIEFACEERYLDPSTSRLLVLPRILDVLNNVSKDPEKMARTAIRIGKMLEYLDVLVLHPEPEGNESAVFEDTTVSSLDVLAQYMAIGLGKPVELHRLAMTDHHGHIYTAAHLRKL